jgi:hypothetical protein
MLNLIKDFLHKQEWQFSKIEDQNVFLFGMGSKNGNFQCVIEVIDEEKKFLFYSIMGANIPPEKRADVLQLINKLNCMLFVGNFEMEEEEGEIRYKVGISYEIITPTLELIEELIMTNISTLDRSLPAIMGLTFGNLTIPQALESVEKERQEDE